MRTNEGAVTVGYVPSERSVMAEIKGLKINQTNVDLVYVHSLPLNAQRSYDRFFVSFGNVVWDVQERVAMPSSQTPEGQQALDWSIANDQSYMQTSPERSVKVSRLFGFFQDRVRGIRTIQQYVDGLSDYLAGKKAELYAQLEESNRENEERKRQLAGKLKGKPDPLDQLVALVDSTSD